MLSLLKEILTELKRINYNIERLIKQGESDERLR